MATLPYEVYELLEKKLGKEEAKEIGKTIEKVLETIEEKAKQEKEIAKVQLKEELKNELATKEDIKLLEQKIETVYERIETVRQEFKGEIRTLEWKMKLWIAVVIFLILFTNRQTIELLLKVIGVLK